MATNKHAVIRYEALDRCFSNKGRKFFIDDLIRYVSEALTDYTGKDYKGYCVKSFKIRSPASVILYRWLGCVFSPG